MILSQVKEIQHLVGMGKLIVDKEALEMMRYSKADYAKVLVGKGFKVIESHNSICNRNETSAFSLLDNA